MKAEIGKMIFYLTRRLIMAFLDNWAGSADRCAAGVSRAPSCAQLPGNSCKIFSESVFQNGFSGAGRGAADPSRRWVRFLAPIPTTVLSESSLPRHHSSLSGRLPPLPRHHSSLPGHHSHLLRHDLFRNGKGGRVRGWQG